MAPFESAEGLIYVNPRNPKRLSEILSIAPALEWIQLPYAGIEPYLSSLDSKYRWTCGKGIYARPVAEMALGLLLTGFRGLNVYVRASKWEAPKGENLIGANILILGGGGISQELVKLLHPFDCQITIVRKLDKPLFEDSGTGKGISGEDSDLNRQVEIKTTDNLPQLYKNADAVVVALALTPETENIIDAAALKNMQQHCWVVNVARGKHIHTPSLVQALQSESIGGAGLDVTEPEPLPEEHPLWNLENCVITPHVGNTPEMGIKLLLGRVTENVRRFCTDEELLGPVNIKLGY